MTGKSTAISCLASALSTLKRPSLFSCRTDSGIKGAERAEGPAIDTKGDTPAAEEEDDDGGEDEQSPRSGVTGTVQNAVHCRFLNPKSLETPELLGEFNPMTKEWRDGVASAIIRDFAVSENQVTNQWIIFDGPIDSLWVECLNTVLDDNQMLCLPNGKARVKLQPSCRS